MFMSLIRILLLGVLLCRAALAIDSAPAFTDPQLQARYEHLTQQLRCPQCQNDNIADSDAPLAVDLRRELRDQIASGKSDAEVLKFLTDRYGAFILFKPPFEPRTLFLWLGPGILLLGGLAIAVRIILQRAKLPIEPDSNQETESEHA